MENWRAICSFAIALSRLRPIIQTTFKILKEKLTAFGSNLSNRSFALYTSFFEDYLFLILATIHLNKS